jgi:hypothetical protein
MANSQKLVKINSDKTVEFLSRGAPKKGTRKTYISGSDLEALRNGATVKVDNRTATGFRVVA